MVFKGLLLFASLMHVGRCLLLPLESGEYHMLATLMSISMYVEPLLFLHSLLIFHIYTEVRTRRLAQSYTKWILIGMWVQFMIEL